MKNSDFIISLSWPYGQVLKAGAWYDLIFAKKKYYQVGHSAMILVNSQTKKLYYMDFGRYHTPFGFGRARSPETDFDVSIDISANIKNGSILNIKEILMDAYNKEANHGDGTLYASVIPNVDFNSVINYTRKLQNKGLIPYGPFHYQGLNCTRFVAMAIKNSGIPFAQSLSCKIYDIMLRIPLLRKISINHHYNFIIKNKISEKKISSKIIPRPKNISKSSKLLNGVGCSAWFHLSEEKNLYRIKRFSENGKEESSGLFSVNDLNFKINQDYHLTYVSHCKTCKIIQNNRIYEFNRVK